jgi:ADP-ribose pyrophosphatase
MTDAPRGADDTERDPGAAGDEPAAPSFAHLAERPISSRVVHRGHYLEMRVVEIERADGRRSQRDIVWHPGAVAIVALDPEDRLLLVRQFRLAAGAALLELPAGTLDVDAETGSVEDPDVAAARELDEETGYRAGSLERIGEFWTAPGFATELMYLYVASELTPARDDGRLGIDADEVLELERLTLDEALDAVDRGEICDAKSIIGVLQAARRRAGR